MSVAFDFNAVSVVDADDPHVLAVDSVGTVNQPAAIHPSGKRGSEPELIRQFNNTWTYVQRSKARGIPENTWEFRCECGTHRKFLPAYFSDPYGAALHSRDTHHCVRTS